ncbi:MAG: hypothetical protein MZV70_00310 [Desulfobacterales bacterium]|nr:hypothetical protein [Desulfobacterales bacterium]
MPFDTDPARDQEGHRRAGGLRRSRSWPTRPTGPGGTALVIELMTDNRNRAVAGGPPPARPPRRQAGVPGLRDLHVQEARHDHLRGRHGQRGPADGGGARAGRRGPSDRGRDGHGVHRARARYILVKEGLEKKGFKAAGGEVAMLPDTTVPVVGDAADALGQARSPRSRTTRTCRTSTSTPTSTNRRSSAPS